MVSDDSNERCNTDRDAEGWKEDGGGQMIHERIREAVKRVEGISGELEYSHTRRSIDRGTCAGATSRKRSQMGGGGATTLGDIEALKSSTRWRRGGSASVSEAGMKGLRDTLALSMELLDAGETSTSANTAAMEDISAWLSHLAQRQQVTFDGGCRKTLRYPLGCSRRVLGMAGVDLSSIGFGARFLAN